MQDPKILQPPPGDGVVATGAPKVKNRVRVLGNRYQFPSLGGVAPCRTPKYSNLSQATGW